MENKYDFFTFLRRKFAYSKIKQYFCTIFMCTRTPYTRNYIYIGAVGA